MPKSPLKNISVQTFREYLKWKGLAFIRTNSGHEIWGKKGLLRPVVFQTHKDPVPEEIVRNNLKTLGVKAKDYIDFLES